jgi:hypothetical protein
LKLIDFHLLRWSAQHAWSFKSNRGDFAEGEVALPMASWLPSEATVKLRDDLDAVL